MASSAASQGSVSQVADTGFIGVMDSGVGGITVLRRMMDELPHERFVFFGDTAHAPYGDRTREEVLGYTRAIVDDLRDEGAKAVVIACNTATSAAVATLRAEHPEVPIVGVEPALKPAVLAHPAGQVLVMATALTLHLDKYQDLVKRWGHSAEVHEVACVGLMERIEREHWEEPDLIELLQTLVGGYAGAVDAVVLGCTHYPFVKEQIRAVLGHVDIFDGALGTARQLRTRLVQEDLLAPDDATGCVSFRSSTPGREELARYQRFLKLASSA